MQLKLTILSLFLVSNMSLNGQITLTAPTQKANKGDVVSAEIKVKSRDTISVISFNLEWDPSVLTYQKIENFGLTAAQYDTFGITNVATGVLKFNWVGVDAYFIKDSMVVFKVNFKVMGNNGTNSPIRFLKPKAYNSSVNVDPITVTAQDGAVMVNTLSAIGVAQDIEGYAQLSQSYPNPVSNTLLIPFYIKETDEVTLFIYDTTGKQVFSQKKKVEAGNQKFELNTEGVLQSGVYVYGIQTRKGFVSKTLIKM